MCKGESDISPGLLIPDHSRYRSERRNPEEGGTQSRRGEGIREDGAMTPEVSLNLFAQLLWQAVVVSAPLLLTVLLVGLLVSIFQVVTQIQEMSLSFVPKLLASVFILVLTGPWMLGLLASYSSALIRSIPSMVQ